jgi:hypothetical protein
VVALAKVIEEPTQKDEPAPVIAAGAGLMVNTAVVVVVPVKVMIVVPVVRPVRMPVDEPMVATARLLLDQVPTDGPGPDESNNVVAAPTHAVCDVG